MHDVTCFGKEGNRTVVILECAAQKNIPRIVDIAVRDCDGAKSEDERIVKYLVIAHGVLRILTTDLISFITWVVISIKKQVHPTDTSNTEGGE